MTGSLNLSGTRDTMLSESSASFSAVSSGIRTPERVWHSSQASVSRHVSPPPGPELSTTASTHQNDSVDSDKEAGPGYPEAPSVHSMPGSILDWILIQQGTLDAKLKSMDRLDSVGLQPTMETATAERQDVNEVGGNEGSQEDAGQPEASNQDTQSEDPNQEQPSSKDDSDDSMPELEPLSRPDDSAHAMMTGALPVGTGNQASSSSDST